jgi:hypothetical protein
MSFNITSDGSPTPRKAMGRLPVPDDLWLDTSPEGLGLAVGSRYQQQHYPPHRGFNSSLTSHVQGTRRALGPSAQINQIMPQQAHDSFKVSPVTPPNLHIHRVRRVPAWVELQLTSLAAQGRLERSPGC